ncbi:Hypothetical protein R9X50_00558100 [Acrodontium crateriforme]|uniref:PKS/mFAS DH domain-containing protein n=1 Tax=Acrodontium crateriforme TaxID=150365 RepID=A0AAQ3RD99_9PEZI|nr:Hypothetical protein R9X50_00558100 [Acrodontium crateriforme]
MRSRSKHFLPLLGDASPESAAHYLKWKNVLRSNEIGWLEGNQVQGQIIFPAAGYVSPAVEAALTLADVKSIALIEITDFHIHNALTSDDDNEVEVLIELSNVSDARSGSITASFTYSAALSGADGEIKLAASSTVKIILGPQSTETLPSRRPAPPHLITVEQSRLYNFMESLEYDFTGHFRSLSILKQKLGKAQCTTQKADTTDAKSLLIHPVDLDASFQSIMLAYSYPGDDKLRNLYLPTSISKIRLNPVTLAQTSSDRALKIDSICHQEDRVTPGVGFSGHVEIYMNGLSHSAIQVDRVLFKPIKSGADFDRNVFYKMHWVPSAPDGHRAASGIPISQNNVHLLWTLNSPARKESPLCHYLNYARRMTRLLRSGKHKCARQSWANDTVEDVRAEVTAKVFEDNSDVKIMFLVGETMPRVFTEETTMLEHFRESGLLDEYYARGFRTMQSSLWLSQATKQITDRSPHLTILDIGAGTGGATKNIRSAIGHYFDSYIFTDISSSFFENAAEIFTPWRELMVFKVCDAEKDPLVQGFVEGTYDVVIGSLVVHTTAELDKTMRNLRKLLKLGGYLVIGEGSSDGPLQSGDGFIFGALTGWWLGIDEGRNLSPFINVPQCDSVLERTGFSGIDTLSPPEFLETFGVILFVAQAVDERLIVVAKINELTSIFKGIAGEIVTFDSLETVDHALIDRKTTVLSLTELDRPAFKEITEKMWYSFRKFFEAERTVLWVTKGRLEDKSFSNMIVGLGRSAVHELDNLRLQFVEDIPDVKYLDAKYLAETLIRYHAKTLEDDNLLYVAEPEMILDSNSTELVPRLAPIMEANERYNSLQRPIPYKVDLSTSIVELEQAEEGFYLRELTRYDINNEIAHAGSTKLRTTNSSSCAIQTIAGHLFLVIGKNKH